MHHKKREKVPQLSSTSLSHVFVVCVPVLHQTGHMRCCSGWVRVFEGGITGLALETVSARVMFHERVTMKEMAELQETQSTHIHGMHG